MKVGGHRFSHRITVCVAIGEQRGSGNPRLLLLVVPRSRRQMFFEIYADSFHRLHDFDKMGRSRSVKLWL